MQFCTTSLRTKTIAAAAQVFAVPELLEAILLNLETRELLFSQRINHRVKSVLEGSLKLKQKLFLAVGHCPPTCDRGVKA